MQEEDSTECKSSSSSFLSQLQNRLQSGLKPTQTKTTFADGSVQYSTCQGSELELETSRDNKPVRGLGFVVDDKPDLTIGKVRPWLFVSSQDVPNDMNLLKEHKVSHILSLLPGFVLSEECAEIIEDHLTLEVYDEESFELNENLYQRAFNFIDNAKESAKNAVLIHCNAGLSRAPTFAIAYLMKTEKLGFDEIFVQLKAVRSSIRPNAGFLKQLQKLPLCQEHQQ